MIAGADLLRQLSAQDFLALGVQQLAYIRPVIIDGAKVYSIHAADGTQLAIHDDEIAAMALTRENALQPLSVQ